jgi:Phosphotransferase enzyme family
LRFANQISRPFRDWNQLVYLTQDWRPGLLSDVPMGLRSNPQASSPAAFAECDEAIIENMACSSSGNGKLQDSRRILAIALPNYRVRSLETLEGGATNAKVLVRFESVDELFVLRQYLRGTEVCRKEVRLLHALQDLIPVPSLVKSDIVGNEAGIPYLIYRFLPGLTFRLIRANGSPRDMADAAHAIGRCLGALQNCDVSLFDACRLDERFRFTEHQLAHPVLEESIGAAEMVTGPPQPCKQTVSDSR